MGEKERKVIDLFKSSLSEIEWERLCKHYSARDFSTIIKYICAAEKNTENIDKRALKRVLQNEMQATKKDKSK